MTIETIGTMYTGFGGVDVGAMAAGLVPRWGIEYNAKVAAVANHNLGGHVRVANVLDEDPNDYDAVDVFHASPPCPSFSVAKVGGSETDQDIALACKVAEFIEVLQPQVFTLENVWGYRKSQSWSIIRETLNGAGYWMDVAHVNAADFGVPQTRKRMIIRAIRGSFVPYLPEPEPWVGWYEAIEDLIPTLPASCFATWQLDRLPAEMSPFILGNGTYSFPKDKTDPADTITSNDNQMGVRAFIVPGGNATSFGIRTDAEPVRTVESVNRVGNLPRACLVNESSSMEVRAAEGSSATQVSSSRTNRQRAWLSSGRIVSMTPRALARFQTFPDWYDLPESKSLAAYGIGNAVPPLLYEKIIRQLMEYIAR